MSYIKIIMRKKIPAEFWNSAIHNVVGLFVKINLARSFELT